jgi:ribosome-binding protein aMBF1 (putative translation factor)
VKCRWAGRSGWTAIRITGRLRIREQASGKTKAESRDKKVDKIIGANIRRFRNERGLSQTALGRLLRITFQQIQKYESGLNSIAAARIPALCEALDISLEELFEGTLAKSGRTKRR